MIDLLEKSKFNDKKLLKLEKVSYWPKTRLEEQNSPNEEIQIDLNYKQLVENMKIIANLPTESIPIKIINDSTKDSLYFSIEKTINVKMKSISISLYLLSKILRIENFALPNLEFVNKNEDILFKGDEFLSSANLIDDGEMKLDFWPSYQVQSANPKCDMLKYDEIDSKLARFYFKLDKQDAFKKELNDLRGFFEITVLWNGSKYERIITSKQIDIEIIRDRFTRLYDLNQMEIFRNQQQQAKSNKSEVSWERLETFVEHEDSILEKIDEIFKENQIVYIRGKSGCGKTTLAREYAAYLKNLEDNISLVFIRSGSLKENINKLNERYLKIKESNEQILLIFDDVKEDENINGLLQEIDRKHKIIITTSALNLSIPNERVLLQLEDFNKEKCLEYLKKHQIDLSDKLVEKLASPAKLEAVVKQLKTQLVNFKAINYQEDKTNRVNFILNEIKRKDSLAFEILKHLSYLDNRNLVVELIEDLFVSNHVSESLEFLLEIDYLKKINENCFEMEKKNQNNICKTLQNEETEIKLRILESLINLVRKNSNKNTAKLAVEKIDEIFNHIEKLTKISGNNLTLNNKIIILIKQVKEIIDGNFYKIKKNIEITDIAIQIVKKYSNQEVKTCQIANSKGELKYNLAKYQEALEIFENTLEVYKNNLHTNQNNPNIALSLKNIGLVNYSLGKYDEAFKNFTESLNIENKVLNKNNPNIAIGNNNIGNVYYSKGQYDTALEFYETALKIESQFFASNHQNIATTKTNIGNVHFSKGEYDKAFECYQKIFRNKKRNSAQASSRYCYIE